MSEWVKSSASQVVSGVVRAASKGRLTWYARNESAQVCSESESSLYLVRAMATVEVRVRLRVGLRLGFGRGLCRGSARDARTAAPSW